MMIREAQISLSKRNTDKKYYLYLMCVFGGTMDLRQIPNYHGERIMWELGIKK